MELPSLYLLLVTSFIGLFSCALSNTDGFLSIDCGSFDNVTEYGLQWISDSPFIKIRNVSTSPSSRTRFRPYLTFAYFTNLAAKKYCYRLPVKRGQHYVVRASFSPNYTIPLARFFDLTIEGFKWTSVNLSSVDDGYWYYEIILAAKSYSLSICLARNSYTEEKSFVYISGIELRPLEPSMYISTDFQKQALDLVDRSNFGATTTDEVLYYPDDRFDRYWWDYPASGLQDKSIVDVAAEYNQTESIGSELQNQPPVNVLRTAIARKVVDGMKISPLFTYSYQPGLYSFALYFCNINQTNLTQIFTAFINDYQISDYLSFKFKQCLQVDKILELPTSDPLSIILQPHDTSELGPFINGAEMFRILDVQTTTHSGDVVAIRKIAEAITFLDDWTGGDPCLPAEYSSTGITCSQDDPPRVSIINLTNMHLKGGIPSNIVDLTALTQLLLGNNNFSGNIPDLSSLKNLTILQLQNNQLTGGIPTSLEKLQMLTQLFLQGNRLEGTVLKGLVKPNLDLRVDPQNVLLTDGRKIKGWVIGLLIGCSVVLILVILSGILLWRHKHPSQPLPSTDDQIPSHRSIFADENNENEYHRLAIEYTEEDIKSATNNYSRLIGKGGFGSVYHGRLSGYDVAVKVLVTGSNQGIREFQNEVAVLSRIYHKNLVHLIGYCKQPIMGLVYEYMPYGTLNDHLYGVAKSESRLDWHTRVNIALQAADGLLYLHQGCYPPIIHRDIKCSNILLDSRMSAKLGDFGISKLVESSTGYTSTAVKGTLGYLDPEYFATMSLNEKSDVYSFGVVLLEIISGVSPKDGIVQSARNLLSCGKIADLVDSSLGGRYNVASAWKVAEVAYTCLERESKNRPKMGAVVKELEEAVALIYDDNYSDSGTMASFNCGDMPSLR